ncbi:LD-carboxypeptidase [Salinicoccus cyprini]|uniref:LD-carboxypeptidase n=1 Tax=Salinicoccus cyprini TaxID=2493691 RepID=A0A558B045_9STAP|nr:S66 peptidase family protein [Salinicoccus cyprini]TVT29873.1 LD-carboxypeptidase [Salinicoccus cyprini]
MIQFPVMKKNATIGITAPSSGVPEDLHDILKSAIGRMEQKGYSFKIGETAWTDDKARSASAEKRAVELKEMLADETVDMIIPPWGGELLIEMLEHMNFNNMPAKWMMGYSDTSTLLLAITLNTGIATAHGTNLIDLRGEESDATTAMWEIVLSTEKGEAVTQHSSKCYQKEWDFENPTPHIFNLSEETHWQTVSGQSVRAEGRLLGGCIDTIRHLIGTPYGNVQKFREKYIPDEPVIWYLENCEMSTTDLRRSLVQMKLAGWFKNVSAIMFGRSPANMPVENYMAEDVYKALSEELDVPIAYDIDCGHMPPQITFINGAYAKVIVKNGHGTVLQRFS